MTTDLKRKGGFVKVFLICVVSIVVQSYHSGATSFLFGFIIFSCFIFHKCYFHSQNLILISLFHRFIAVAGRFTPFTYVP